MKSTHEIDIAGTRLECAWFAPRECVASTVIVLLHEGLGCVAMWRDFPESLSEATGLRVFAFSRAGYGASDPANLPRTSDYMHVEAHVVLPAVLAVAGITTTILLGASDGGTIALLYAAQHHRNLRGVIAIAPHVLIEDKSLQAIARAGQQYRQGGLAQHLARYHGTRVDHTFWGWHDVWLSDAFKTWNIEASMAEIVAPLLLVQGREDEYGTLAQLSAIECATPASVRRVVIERCGHSPYREHPVQTLDAIRTFVAGLRSDSVGKMQ